ncbi:vacuolar membrane protein [Cryptococcus wingfieldii CBS 7118]|uniref:E3 ubiquitin-protein ligase PEP5 n=1 Tax=Cryptococcus wingfieldii CBS 7118 TaxID=1295528 RepID=A0A1E3IXW3_9TREE|nr:vacuolar membrane protein [Cryptococcus wingfieldii CBS 7118]ODN93457.1 vacuolar membrane protein [Cryptococcus wingfieldii CBS 7118]
MAIPPSHAGTSAPQWRQFTFFDVHDVKDTHDLDQSPRAIRQLTPPLAVTSTTSQSPLPPSLILASGQTITQVDRYFTPERSFTAWERNGRATALLEAGGLLVGIGEEDGSLWPVLKVWDLTKEDKKHPERRPVLLRNVRIQHGQRPHPVSAVALTTTLSHLAIGLGDGTVLLYRHFLQSLTTSPTALTSLPKARVVHQSHEPVTGLGFNEQSSSSNLFIVTTNRVLCAPVSGKGEARTIDELGCGLGCAVMDWERKDMVVARDEAIYLYSPEGRGASFAYEGPKSSIAVFNHNLVITSPPFHPSASSNSATIRHYVKANPNGDSPSVDIAKITVFDLQNKLVGYSGTYKDGVRDVYCQWGGIYVHGGNGKLARLEEHSTQAKLDVLYRRNLFTLAISLARQQGLGDAGVSDIHRRYGDYLYNKGDFEGAMSQFVKTLGNLQPSYVIRKFLDAQRIHNLTTYLQELHSRGLANPDHTTLLLNCYTKTSDRTRLDQFIKTEAHRTDTGAEELPFDLDTAIRVCRQAGFYEHATYLAKKFGRHEDYLRIQIEDAGKVGEALRYLRSLGPKACDENMVRYGRTLLHQEPAATTALLVDLCSGNLGKKKASTPPQIVEQLNGTSNGTNGATGPAMLSYLGYNKVSGLFTGEATGTATPTDKNEPQRVDPEETSALEKLAIESEGPDYVPPSPRQYFAHFVDHLDLFVHFLEAVALNLWDQKVDLSVPSSAPSPIATREVDIPPPDDPTGVDQRAVWNTLIELYLSATKSLDSTVASQSREKALALISSKDTPYDPLHALVLCSVVGFRAGMVRLWEGMGMYEDVLRYYMEAGEDDGDEVDASAKVFSHLDLYGPTHPQLYPLVLRYLTSSPAILSRHPKELGNILAKIDEYQIMPPLAVVQVLSRNGVVSVGNMKDWLKGKVEDNEAEIESDKQLYDSYRADTAVKRKAMLDRTNPSQPEVFQVTKCASCGGQLDLPSVHFMCKHSYHQRCLPDSDPECPLCARQHSVIKEIRRNQLRLADRHDLFLEEVHSAEDGFGVVADAYGRGLFGREGDVLDGEV